MTYDDVKVHDGQRYMGMAVGGTHEWDYPDGRWDEEKVAPDRWHFDFSSTKRRRTGAPENSGCPVDTEYHWYIIADQRVRKVDKDSYETLMSGLKFKVGHKRPHWRMMSYEYPDSVPYREQVKRILRRALEELEAPAGLSPTGHRSADPSMAWRGHAIASGPLRSAPPPPHSVSPPPPLASPPPLPALWSPKNGLAASAAGSAVPASRIDLPA